MGNDRKSLSAINGFSHTIHGRYYPLSSVWSGFLSAVVLGFGWVGFFEAAGVVFCAGGEGAWVFSLMRFFVFSLSLSFSFTRSFAFA